MTAPYTTGTVTLTNNSAAVVGVATGWATALITGGVLFVEADGNALPILSVTDNTHLTAAVKWKGASGTYAYAIVRDTAYLQQLTTNSQALAALIQELGGDALTALAALTPAADRLPYFNGAATAVLTDIKTKGRDLLSSVDMAGLLGKIGPVFGGVAPEPASAGLGLLNGDLNTINAPGVYSIASTWSNGPFGTTTYIAILEVRKRVYANLYYQTLYFGSGQVWERITTTADAASWPTPWYRADTTRLIHENLNIADDAAYSKAFSGATIGWGMVTGQFSSTPNILFSFRALSSAVVLKIAGVGTSNVYNQTVLSGTTGADGSLNIGASNNTIYVENRLGALTPFGITLFASIP